MYRWLAGREHIPFRRAIHQVLLSTATIAPRTLHMAMEACIISVSATEIAEKTPRVLPGSWSLLQRKSWQKMGVARQIFSPQIFITLNPLILIHCRIRVTWKIKFSSSIQINSRPTTASCPQHSSKLAIQQRLIIIITQAVK
uniref:Uncharacterized protein n=1 Tax=Salix viminalis TaxID=40686 RepID=A0A6N2NAS8_SALVM